MSILRSNFPPVGKCDGGTEGRPSWAPNRSGRIGPVVGARHDVPPKTLLSFSGGRRWAATGVLSSRRGPDEGSLPEAAGSCFAEGCLTPHLFFPSKGWRQCGHRRRRGGSDPSPASPRQVGTPAASHPLPRGEGNDAWGARERLISPIFSHGEKVDRDGRSHQPSRAG